MRKVNIPAKKVMEPGMTIMDINNIWDYIDIESLDLNEKEVDDVLEKNDSDSWNEDYDYRDDSYDSWDDGSSSKNHGDGSSNSLPRTIEQETETL